MQFIKREVKSPKLYVNIQVELIDSTLTEQEAGERIQYELDRPNCKIMSEFIVMLLRAASASMWSLKKLEISDKE